MATQFFRDLHRAAKRRECSKIYTVYALREHFSEWSLVSLSRTADALYKDRVDFVDSLRFEMNQVKGAMKQVQFLCPRCLDKYCSRALPVLVVVDPTPLGK